MSTKVLNKFRCSGFLVGFAWLSLSPLAAGELLEFPKRPADRQLAAFAKAVRDVHAKAMRTRKPWKEAELLERVPSKFLKLEARFAKIKDPTKRARALAELALLYADLAHVDGIGPIVDSLQELDSDLAARLGHFEASENFLVRVVGADRKWAGAALRLAEAARDGYLERFGFTAISKVPGKKIRILIHVDPMHSKSRLYFHPSPPYHGEMRYEVADENSLTRAGKQRLVYGFCHELGHMVAMWGQFNRVEDDKHAWAHYTGCLVVEDVYEKLGNEPWPTWTAFQRRASGEARLLKQIEGKTAGTGSYESILKLFHEIGTEFGTKAYGKAWEWLAAKKRFRRIHHVPYLWLRDLQEALLHVVPRNEAAKVRELFGG